MGLFKRATCRGVAHELVRQGLVSFPSKEAMDEAADAVADSPAMQGPETPEISPDEGHDPAAITEVAKKLIEIGNALMAQAGGGGLPEGMPPMGGPGGEMPPMPPPAPAEAKTAASRDLQDAAYEEALSVMQKVSAETKQAGALMHGNDKGNSPQDAAKTDEVAALDNSQRPQGKYQVPVGDTALDTSKGSIGHLGTHPEKPSNSPSGSNSVTADASKSAAFYQKISKALLGVNSGATQNTPEAAAKTNDVAALDNKNRKPGMYTVRPGGANFSEPQTSRIGTEQPHPNGPSNSPSGTNSVIQASKAASDLSDDAKAYVNLFQKCAEDVGEYLPTSFNEDEKIAAIKDMMGMSRNERQHHLNSLHSKKADLSEIANIMKGKEHTVEKDDPKEDKKDGKSKDKKDEHKDEDSKKESSLMDQIRNIANTATAKNK